jgi:hypothetical protein
MLKQEVMVICSRRLQDGRVAPSGDDRPHGSASAAELREAAGTLRSLVPRFRGGPISEFVPLSIAKLIDAVADSIANNRPVSHSIVTSALEIARHLHSYPPDPPSS